MELLLKNAGNKVKALVVVFLVWGFTTQAQKISISNGNWTNPAIWSPAGVPVSTDNVIINSDVVLDANISFTLSSSLLIRNKKSLIEDVVPRKIDINNFGLSIDSGTIVVSFINQKSGTLQNFDSLYVKKNVSIDGRLENYNSMYVADTLGVGFTGTFTNARVVTTDNFIFNQGAIVNNGFMDVLNVRSELSFSNNDTIAVRKNWEEKGQFINSGYAHIADTLRVYSTGWVENYIVVTTDNFLWIDGTVSNSGVFTAPKITIDPAGKLHNRPNGVIISDLILNNGSIYTYNYSVIHAKNVTSNGQIYGAFGCILIDNNSTISGAIYGPLDFCDATPLGSNPPIDIFTGTVTMGVKFCNKMCSAVGINEQMDNAVSVVVYPNPVTNLATVSITVKEKGTYVVEMIDVLGQKVYESSVEINSFEYEFKVPCEHLPKGTYFLSVKNENTSYKVPLLKME